MKTNCRMKGRVRRVVAAVLVGGCLAGAAATPAWADNSQGQNGNSQGQTGNNQGQNQK